MIQSLARRLVALLMQRDPLSERVHLGNGARRRRRPPRDRRRDGRPLQPRLRRVPCNPQCVRRAVDATSPPPTASQSASGSSFYTAMRILPAAQRDAMFEIYRFCREVDDIADFERPAAGADRRSSPSGATRSTSSTRARSAEGRRPRRPGARVRPRARGFPHRHRRHGDGRARGHPRAELRHARPLLRPGGERGRTAVGARVRRRARTTASCCRIISGARCSSPTSCATSTRTPASDGSICRARRSIRPASTPAIRRRRCAARTSSQACAPLVERARTHFVEADRSWRAARAAR